MTIRNNNSTRLQRSNCWLNTAALSMIGLLAAAATIFFTPRSCAAATPIPSAAATPTYVNIMFHNSVISPINVPAGKTVGGIATITGNAPQASAYGVTARAVVLVQAGSQQTTCMVKLAGGAVWGTAITVPANSTASVPFEDTSPGYPGESYNVSILVQAGSGGPLTVLPGSSLILEGIASQPNNNAY